MTLLLAAAVGYVTARLVWTLLRPTFAAPLFARENFRGRLVPTAAGLVVPVAALLVEGGRAVAGAAGAGEPHGLTNERGLVLLTVVGLGLLGAFDDLAGTSDVRGFRGHVARLSAGELTSGGLKLVGGAALALVVVAPAAGEDVGRLVLDAALVALAANLGNLFDRAPGRMLKVVSLAVLVLAAVTAAPTELVGVAVVVGAGLAMLVPDLHEHLMLGDAGANALGGVAGLGVVLACAPATRNALVVVVLALNLASEFVSFSRVIDRVGLLRAADHWGRRPSP